MRLNKIIEENVEAIDTISKECNIAPTQLREVVSETVPTLVSGIRETAKNEVEIETFLNEFEQDHFDVLLTEPEHLVERENITKGNDVLEYILKSKEVTTFIAEKIATRTGIDVTSVKRVVPMIATILVGLLEQKKLEVKSPKELIRILDKNTDGKLWKEVIKKESKWFK